MVENSEGYLSGQLHQSHDDRQWKFKDKFLVEFGT